MDSRDSGDLLYAVRTVTDSAYVRVPTEAETLAARLVIEPENSAQIAEIVRKCESDSLSLAPLAGCRTLSQLRTEPAAIGISLSRMKRVIDYVPDDMTVVSEAGLTLGALNEIASANGQRLPCDPANPESCTLAAMIASAKTGPLRLSEGLPRDLLIGIRFVGHGGRIVHGGGQVVKNVAGYDLMRVLTGSFGTLGIITETTFKVRPFPPNYTLAIVSFETLDDAFAAARRAHETAPLLHLEVLSSALGEIFDRPERFVVLVGMGGSRIETDYSRARVSNAVRRNAEMLSDAEANTAYQRLRDISFDGFAIVAQAAVPPAELPRFLSSCGSGFRAHAGSGVAQLFLAAASESGEIKSAVTRWRELANELRGNLRILSVRDPAVREGVEMFDKPANPAMTLMRHLKATFDPSNIFNPGCFVGGL